MGIVTKYICDKCAAEMTDTKDIFEIMVECRCYNSPMRNVYEAEKPQALWCRKCCEEFAPLIPSRLKPPPDPPQKGLPELLAEMVREQAYGAASEAVQNHMRENS